MKAWQNDFTRTLQITSPIVQAPMLGVTTHEMVAQISNCGGLGSLPVGGLSPEQTLVLIRKTKALTDKPFAINLFAHDTPEPDPVQNSLTARFQALAQQQDNNELINL